MKEIYAGSFHVALINWKQLYYIIIKSEHVALYMKIF